MFLALLLFGAALFSPSFPEPENLTNILRQASVLGIIAVGQTFVIGAGMIDLSVGMTAGLTVVTSCWLISLGWPTLPVVALSLAVGALLGTINGGLVNWLRLDSLIATFAMLSVLQGVIFSFTDRSVGFASDALKMLADGSVMNVPTGPLLLLLVMVAGQFLLTRSRFGYHLLAVGGNPQSAHQAGIPVGSIRLRCFIVSGACAALAGLMLAGRLGTGYPLAGAGLELDSIVAVVLGGTALAGGNASVLRSVAGVLALAVIANLMNLLEFSAFVQTFVKGLIVIAAIIAIRPPQAIR